MTQSHLTFLGLSRNNSTHDHKSFFKLTFPSAMPSANFTKKPTDFVHASIHAATKSQNEKGRDNVWGIGATPKSQIVRESLNDVGNCGSAILRPLCYSEGSADSSSSSVDAYLPQKTDDLPPRSNFSRCSWITVTSDPAYIAFHDEEWGMPVLDDRKLFELLILAGALAEHCWSELLVVRDNLREAFAGFDVQLIAAFDDSRVAELAAHKDMIFHQRRILAVLNNARLVLKIVKEFGSLSNYLWKYVGHKAIVNKHISTRQIPSKSPKAEIISKDLIKRGFRHVGPMVIYSFMQASGLTNDHQVHCFRWKQCALVAKRQLLNASNKKKSRKIGRQGSKEHLEQELEGDEMTLQRYDFLSLFSLEKDL